MNFQPILDEEFWAQDKERARTQKEEGEKAEQFFRQFDAERMAEAPALAERDRACSTLDKNAKRLKDLTAEERAKIESEVTAQVNAQLNEEAPYKIYFEPKDGWHCTCPKCNIGGRRA